MISLCTAAKSAGMPKQTLYLQAKKTPLPSYMQVVKDKPFIDSENPVWLAYVETYRKRKGLLQKEEMKFKKLIGCTVESIKEIFNPTQEDLNNLLKLIEKKFNIDE